jgi:hypothetical protein
MLAPKQLPPVEYKTAVAVSCIKAVPVRPTYETESLPDTAPDGVLVVAVGRDWARSRVYEGQLEIAVEGCK